MIHVIYSLDSCAGWVGVTLRGPEAEAFLKTTQQDAGPEATPNEVAMVLLDLEEV